MASLLALHPEIGRAHHAELLRQAKREREASLGRGTRPTLPRRAYEVLVALRSRSPARQRQAEALNRASAART
jgi:hypothetical protein